MPTDAPSRSSDTSKLAQPSTHPVTSSQQTWTSLFKNKPRNAGKYIPVNFNNMFDGDALVLPDVVQEAGQSIWCDYLVGFFLDKPLSFTAVVQHLKRVWRLKVNIKVKSDGVVFLFLFSNEDDRSKIIKDDPIIMKNKLFIIKFYYIK